MSHLFDFKLTSLIVGAMHGVDTLEHVEVGLESYLGVQLAGVAVLFNATAQHLCKRRSQ